MKCFSRDCFWLKNSDVRFLIFEVFARRRVVVWIGIFRILRFYGILHFCYLISEIGNHISKEHTALEKSKIRVNPCPIRENPCPLHYLIRVLSEPMSLASNPNRFEMSSLRTTYEHNPQEKNTSAIWYQKSEIIYQKNIRAQPTREKHFCYQISYIRNHISKEHTGETHKIHKKMVSATLAAQPRRSFHPKCNFARAVWVFERWIRRDGNRSTTSKKSWKIQKSCKSWFRQFTLPPRCTPRRGIDGGRKKSFVFHLRSFV